MYLLQVIEASLNLLRCELNRHSSESWNLTSLLRPPAQCRAGRGKEIPAFAGMT
jgi:hypothetical protein